MTYEVSCTVAHTWEWVLSMPQDVRDSPHLIDVVNEHAGAVMNKYAMHSIVDHVRHLDKLDRLSGR